MFKLKQKKYLLVAACKNNEILLLMNFLFASYNQVSSRRYDIIYK